MRWRPIKFLCLLGGLMATSAGVKAQNDSLFLSLPQLFERGSREHLRLAADRLKEEIAQEKARTARTARLPEMTVGLKGGYLGQPIVWQHGLSDPTRPESPDWQQSYAFDFSQPVYQGGRIRYAIRQADLAQELAVLQTAVDQADIKLALLEQYLDLFSLYKQCRVLQRNIEESEQRLRNIRRLCEEGVITNNDVLRSEMQLTDNRLSLSETQNNIRLVSQQLDILLGLDESLLLVPDTTLLSQDCPVATYSEYVDRAYEAEPSMLLLQKQTEMARNQIRLTQAEQMPRLSLYASNTLARPITRTMADLYNNSWNVGLTFTYSLSSLYQNRHRLNEARQQVSLLQNTTDQTRQQIRMTVQKALLKHREALDRVEALKLSVRQAEENYRIMNNRYLNQLAILTDLLDADNLRLNAELQLTTARTRVLYTYYELQRVTGNL